MKSLKDYRETTSAYELYAFLSQKIIAGEIDNYGKILDILYQLPRDKRVQWVYPRLFALIRSVYWGFLKDLDKFKYPKMWETFVIEDPGFPGVGKLKRNSKVLTLFSGMLDIHGYTSFCQKAGRNLSLLKLLDNAIQEDIRRIAKHHDVICQRSRGDEIMLLGAKASSVVFSVMSIIDYFGKRKVIQNKNFRNDRTGNKVMLPDMKVSAGVSGGGKYTPLVITGNGDLSGHLINSAARLQARANKLAPKDTKVLLSNQVYTKLKQEMKIYQGVREKLTGTYFRNAGTVEFKGTKLVVIDMIVRKEEMYKRALEKGFKELFEALKKGQWEGKIFETALGLIKVAAGKMKNFSMSVTNGGIVKNGDLIAMCDKALDEFKNKRYHTALDGLEQIRETVSHIPDFDHLMLEYLDEVSAGYKRCRGFYMEELESILDERSQVLLPAHIQERYASAAKTAAAYQRLRKIALEHPNIGNRKAIWLRIIGEKKSSMK